MLPQNTDILIIGAGPTGLALAVALQQAGIDHVIVDRLASGENTSRAAVIHAHTLEELERIGATAEMMRRGLPLSRFSIRERDRALMGLRFDALPSPYSTVLMIPQDETERVLSERLAMLGGSVHRHVTAMEITQLEGGSGASVLLDTPDGEQTLTARYVVGADGMHSRVREAAGIAFDGSAYEESFVLADVRMDWSLGATEVSLFFAPAGMLVVAPLPNGRFRVVATLEDAPERPGIDDIQRIIDARGPEAGAKRVHDIAWSSRFRLHHRLARSYRAGPLFLMGDAAHVHSPAGGQGMNTGLVDAVVLGQLLTAVIRDLAPDASLDRYEALRRPAAAQVLGLAGTLTSIATAHSRPRRMLRNAALRIANHLPFLRHRLELGFSGLARKDLARVPAA
ncbi:FAD-dependent oxidoreductase [Pararhizobium sp.]|uniref:FAD-dependent oxidoreductase n=1 Tax=Pararhizobium sp. TaxID=1977563 RepID=UPI002723504E|nr:FAD-dependent oxidoreductase [Pararhizobium sp.]MDO9415742.1 FAD-dependent oxidoreductase [Pararhizobium sp.]